MKIFTVLQSESVNTNKRLQQVTDQNHIAVKFGSPEHSADCAIIFIAGGLEKSNVSYDSQSGLLLVPLQVQCHILHRESDYWNIDEAINIYIRGARLLNTMARKSPNAIISGGWDRAYNIGLQWPIMREDSLSQAMIDYRRKVYEDTRHQGKFSAKCAVSVLGNLKQYGYLIHDAIHTNAVRNNRAAINKFVDSMKR